MSWTARTKKDVIIAGTLGLGADLFCQCVCEDKDVRTIDKRRAAAIAIFTGGYIGVTCNYIYSLYPHLSRKIAQSILPANICQARTLGIVSTAADNLVHVPILYIPSYFLAVGSMQGMPLSTSVRNMQDGWSSAVGTCWLFWIPFMAFNFRFMPPSHRVRAVAGANFCWTVALDFITQKSD